MDEERNSDQEPAPPPPAAPPTGDSGLSWGVAVFLLFSLLFVVFVVQNSNDVPVRFVNWEGTFPLPLILVVTALLAVVADEVFGLLRRRRRRRRLAEKEELARYRRS
ncbi:MAG: LapA family protein [Acidimicrobiia bacterium]|nr:LapA family protein [Acidimicrobiia bacterium]